MKKYNDKLKINFEFYLESNSFDIILKFSF
jgi:hypothetical protein